MINALAHLFIILITRLGYLGIAALMGLESACIPLPSELIMPFAGYLVSIHRLTLLGVTIAGAIGSNLGSTLAYLVGATGGRRFLHRYGPTLLINQAELARTETIFARYGAITVLIGRLLPIVRTYISLPAGIARMNFWKFQTYSLLGSIPWCFALAYAGLRAGKAWRSAPFLHNTLHIITIATAAFLLLLAAAWALHHWRHRRTR